MFEERIRKNRDRSVKRGMLAADGSAMLDT